MLERILGTNNSSVATTYYNLAGVYYMQGDYENALNYFEKALDVFSARLGKTHPYTQNTRQAIRLIKQLEK